MDDILKKNIIGWDIENWSKALSYWEEKVDLNNKNIDCLELGAGQGGLSLWLALKGNNVICTDVMMPMDAAAALHAKYNCTSRISYELLDAAKIGYKNKFDIVIFKSILGGVGSKDRKELILETINGIYNSLNYNGKLLFVENLEGSFLHKFLRKNFIKWGKSWNYVKYRDVKELFSVFEEIEFRTYGFFATFGRNEKQRYYLSKIDYLINPLIPSRYRYIIMGIATKKKRN